MYSVILYHFADGIQVDQKRYGIGNLTSFHLEYN